MGRAASLCRVTQSSPPYFLLYTLGHNKADLLDFFFQVSETLELELELDSDSIMFPYAAILSVLSDKTEEPLINKQIFFR